MKSLHKFAFQTSTMLFETSFHVEKDKKQRNTVFGYAKGLTWKLISFLKALDVHFFGNAVIHYDTKSILKDLVSKIHFSLAFYAEKLKNHKIHFLVTKSGQNYNLITFLDPRPKNCIYFISNFPWTWALHTSSGGGMGQGILVTICPPSTK